jgi:hypothetical protein
MSINEVKTPRTWGYGLLVDNNQTSKCVDRGREWEQHETGLW